MHRSRRKPLLQGELQRQGGVFAGADVDHVGDAGLQRQLVAPHDGQVSGIEVAGAEEGSRGRLVTQVIVHPINPRAHLANLSVRQGTVVVIDDLGLVGAQLVPDQVLAARASTMRAASSR
jgi:hypothetical protein